MMIASPYDNIRPINLANPLNRHHPLNRGLVAWWRVVPGLDGGNKWYDLAGLNHGTLVNMGSGSGWKSSTRPGSFGHLLFDSTNDYVDCGQSTPLKITTGTAAAWLNYSSGVGYKCLVSMNNVVSAFWTAYGLGVSSGQLNWTAQNGIGSSYFDLNSAITANTWCRGVGTYDGTTARMYVNGIQVASSAFSGAFHYEASQRNLCIGGDLSGISGTAGSFFSGAIDDIQIYSRALSAAEIFAEYSESRRGNPERLNRLSPMMFGSGFNLVPFAVYEARRRRVG